jgi:hypothetical protein
MVHRYPTRFQIKRQEEQRRAAEQMALHETIHYVKDALERMVNMKCYCCRLVECTKMFEHLYENPILLTGYSNFRTSVWNKMNETENHILSTLQSMPARLSENNEYDMHIRILISNLLDLMERIRTKYW